LELHQYFLGVHPLAREYKKDYKIKAEKWRRKGKPVPEPFYVEMNNFQTVQVCHEQKEIQVAFFSLQILQLSSHEPLVSMALIFLHFERLMSEPPLSL